LTLLSTIGHQVRI